ncbi:hypothetical protein ACFP1Z_09990 [Streptomyces gamaensis]|uniref:SET domain-containing protein n=1 Tax=Streptomyces gamaensis TaxID=1763542 RepID=A0ABW0Z1H4_9ACTN
MTDDRATEGNKGDRGGARRGPGRLLALDSGTLHGTRCVTGHAMPLGALVAELPLTRPRTTPDRYTIQIAPGRYIDPPGALRHLNHSCVPNTFVDVKLGHVRTLRPVGEGEALTFFYPSTEWEVVNPFRCACGHRGCLGAITGAHALPVEILRRYALNDHIRELLGAREASVRD